MDLQPTHSMFNDIIGNNNAVGFDEVVRQSLELSNLSAPDMSTAMNNIFEGTESRHEQENDGTVDCGFRVDKLDIDPFFPPPSPVSPDASLLGLQLDPSNYNHIQINEQECQAGDVNSLSKLYSAPGTTKDRAVTQYHDETVKNLPRADSQRPPPETNETVVRTTLEAPSNSTTCAMDKGPTLQSDFIACPDPPVNLLAQDLQTLDSLAIPTVNSLHLTPNPQTCAAINPNPFVTGNEKPDIQQLLLLLRENPHLPYKKQKVGHNKSFTGTVSNHLAIPERTTSDQQNVRAHGNAKVF
ncbi:hypothetical protein BWQ96_05559 [Gracilariopsis chorda]|uniref:Uncharacterized protein n=1 Tax=Gracilariopsis chorda TaxID=448386 RepID=A0A2V3IRF9_9FLOR|nr:hypothetical protein BWQ96_05559 [Gracilariopsis chorda]|eukprot:PXF44702.1 hypothetical protein BWQ96_05559 [Gracilariopsis chorda]